jgi:cytoskeletal protein RodZ
MLNTSYRAAPKSALDVTANAAQPRASSTGKSFRSNALAAMDHYTAGPETTRPAAKTNSRQVSASASKTSQNPVAAQTASLAIQNGTPAAPSVPAWAIPGPLMGAANIAANAATTTAATVQSKSTAATSAAAQAAPLQPASSTQVSAPQDATAQPTGDDATLQSLENALNAAGIDYSNFGLATHNDTVTYPGGSYINSYISASVNGDNTELMTNLVAINPNVAVGDIQRMLGEPVTG